MKEWIDLPGELMDEEKQIDEAELFEYKGGRFPEYLKHGKAAVHIIETAKKFCKGAGLDVGGLECCHFPGAQIVNKIYGGDAFDLPRKPGGWDYIFSSHCLEHLENYIGALSHWRDCLKTGGRLFLYLPHYDMTYWRPKHCEKHQHSFFVQDLLSTLNTLGFSDILGSGRDLYWSFAITGVKR